jgi:alpha-beta hydrolase superfamily lysophospholipase
VARNSEDVLWDPPPPAADERLVYGPEPKQFGDLRLPPGPGPHPLAIVIHGGYWKAQYNLIHTGHMCEALKAEGIATWNVEYRAYGDVGGSWPSIVGDVHRAVAFGEQLAAGAPVVLVGHSAGGQLALLAAQRKPLPVVALAAISDPAAVGRELPEDATPIRHLPLGVPQILIHGTADDSVPFELSARYAAAAEVEARLIPLEGAGHFEAVDPQSREWPHTLAAIRELVS